MNIRIEAELFSEDRVVKHVFNAARWFEGATDNEIIGVAARDYDESAETDSIALSIEKSERAKPVFEYCRKHKVPFGCRVNQRHAMDWVKERRPELLPKLVDEEA